MDRAPVSKVTTAHLKTRPCLIPCDHFDDSDSSDSSSVSSIFPQHHEETAPVRRGCLKKAAPSTRAHLDVMPVIPRRKQRVHFNPKLTVRVVKVSADVKPDDVWLSATDYANIKFSILQDICSSKQSGKSSIFELRGLEALLPAAVQRKQLRRRILTETVLMEQSKVSDEALMRISETVSCVSRREALERARIDAQLASLSQI